MILNCSHTGLIAVPQHHRRLELCVEHLKDWCSSQKLRPQTTRHEPNYLFRCRQTDRLHPWSGVILNNELSIRQHVGKLSSTSFFHLHCLRQFRWMLDASSWQRLVSAVILSYIDFCNAVLAGLPACMLAPLQQVLNTAVQFITVLPARAHVTDTMRLLHWLLVTCRIRYKHRLVIYTVYNGISPSYIAYTTTRISTLPGRGRLRSVNTNEFDKIQRERFLCGRTTRMECSAGRDQKYLHSSMP